VIGRGFRGGRIRRRDRWYGLERRPDFGHFKRWWHRQGKRRHDDDIGDREKAIEAYEDWVRQGRPRD
jgi:hypothetical protein